MLFWSLPRQRDVMPYRSPGCADVLRVARAHVTDFSYMTLMDKPAVKHNMLKDHIVIVGGPENSLERNYHYSIEKDLNFIARRADHTNVRFVNLLRRHNEPWINRKVRSVNLRLDWALLGHGMSHLSVIDTTTIGIEEYITHGLHLNSRGKRKLMHLIADKLDGGHVSGVSSIPVIMRARTAPFLG